MAFDGAYTCQLGAGLGLIPETLDLLRIWEPGISAAKLADRAVSEGILARATARRVRNIVAEMFAPRFMVNGGEPAAHLKRLVAGRIHDECLT